MPKLPLDPPNPLVYLITDRFALRPPPTNSGAVVGRLVEFIERAFAAGVDMLQIRERDLPTRDILSVSEAAVRIARNGARVTVNDRADVARCAGCGVHLTTHSLPVEAVRRVFGRDIIIGASTHNLEEAVAAEKGGADFVVFGPVYDTSSKRSYGPPVGVASLRTVTRRVRIPVLALGGITLSNFHETLEAGAAGVAGISLFADARDLEGVIRTIKGFVRLSSN